MEPQQGLLRRKHGHTVPVSCRPHGAGFSDRPAYFEILNLSESLEPDEIIALRCGSSPVWITCQVLDGTHVCAVVASL